MMFIRGLNQAESVPFECLAEKRSDGSTQWIDGQSLRLFGKVLLCMVLLLWTGCASHPTRSVNYPGPQNLAPGNSSPEFSTEPARSPGDGYTSSLATPGSSASPLQDSNRSTTVVPARPEPSSSEGSFWSQTDLLLGPRNVIARPGSEVILTVGLRDKTGHLRMNQRIDWTISPDSVGHFSKIQEREMKNLLVFDFVKPQILSDTQAVTTTSRTEMTLDRGTPNLNDDIVVRRGESWVSVTSPREGVTIVTATAGKQSDGVCKSQSSRIIWVDAAVKLPQSKVLDFGSTYTLATALRRVSDETPLERWRVRYQILGNSSAVFADGNKMLEVYTNGQGEAKVAMSQSVSRQEETVVNIQIIKPAGENFAEPVIVQESKLHFRWSPNTINIQKTMQSEALIGDVVPASIFVTNLTDRPLQNIRVVDVAQPGLVLKGAVPEGKDAPEGRQWLLETLAPHSTYVIQLNYRVEQPGSYLSFSQAQTQKMGNDLIVECAAPLSAGSDTSPYTPVLPQSGAQNAVAGNQTFESPQSGTNPASSEVSDPFDSSTKPLPPPQDESEDVYVPGGAGPSATTGPQNPEAPSGSSAEPPSTPPLSAETPKNGTNDSEIASKSPENAPLFPPEDPNAQVGLEIEAPARVKTAETFRVYINIANRANMDLHNVDIQLSNTNGISNQNPSGDLKFIQRNIQVLPEQRMTRIRTDLLAVSAGEQVVQVKIALSNGKEYRREAHITVLESEAGADKASESTGGSAETSGGMAPPPASPTSPPASPTSPPASPTSPPASPTSPPASPTSPPAEARPGTDSESVPDLGLPPDLGTDEAQNPAAEGTVGELLESGDSADDPLFTISIQESKPEIKVGDSFDFVLEIINTQSAAVKNAEILFALAPGMTEIQKESVQGPGKAEVNPVTGLLRFSEIPEIAPGQSVKYTVTVKAVKAGAFQPHVQILEDGVPKSQKTKETSIK